MAYDGSIKIDTKVDTTGFSTGISKISGIAKTGLAAAGMAVGAITTAMTVGGTAAVKVGSDFESAMSKVSAISGATGNDLTALTEKAKEMGAKTKFSASESAAALQYMAMAGWDTESMLSGIGGIMSLAAADGLDLATTSDIVTDAITAFGLQASDSSHFADVLARASSSANTNVSMLGESFKYVAPLAGSMGYSVEDVSIALGLMANASVKGSMAGTSLKTALANLASPTKQMQMIMDEYGISLVDSNDKALPLIDVIKQLREKFGGLSETEQTAAASTLFGKEAMAGMLAIINASDSDFNKLTTNINNADGAAEAMATTMQDNLQGQITILKSALEGLGIEIYESAQEPLKNAAIEGQNSVNRLTEAFKNGGLNKAVDEAGSIFAELVAKAAEQAPKMVDTAIKFIKSFVNGIVKNKKQLEQAAKSIVKALVDGIVALLPSSVKKPVAEFTTSLQQSFENGGLKKAINTVSTLISNCGKVVSAITKTVLPPLSKAIDTVAGNLNIIIPLVTTAAAAYEAWKIISTITTMLTAHTVAVTAEGVAENIAAMAAGTATAAYSAKSIVVGVLTGEIGLATAAQYTWNAAMSANPIGLVVVAVAALTAGIAALCLTQEQEQTNTDILVEQSNERMEKLNDERQAYEDLKKAQEQQAEEDILQVDHAKVLYDELSKLVDGNGKVTEANKARADFIVGELNEALGTELELTGNQITGYQNLKDSIDDLVESRKAEILLDANRETYEAALENITTAKEAETQATYDLAAAEDELEKYLSDERLAQLPEATQEQMDAWKSWGDYDVAAAKANINTLKDNLHTASEDVKQYTDDIVSYENAMVASKQGNTEKVLEYLGHENDGYTSAKELEEKSAKERREIIGQNYADSLVELDNYVKKYGKSTEAHHKEEIQKLQTQAQKARLEAERVGNGIVDGTVTGIDGAKLNLENTLTSLGKNMPNWVAKAIYSENPYALGSGLGQDFGQGYADGLNNKVFAAAEAGANIAKAAAAATKRTQQSNSPSKVTRRYGHDYGAGYAIGIADEKTKAIKASKSLVTAATNALSLSAIPLPNLVDQAKDKLQNANLVAKMRAAISADHANVSTNLTSNVIHTVKKSTDDNNKPIQLQGTVHTHVNIDGRETAIAVTPFVAEELAFTT